MIKQYYIILAIALLIFPISHARIETEAKLIHELAEINLKSFAWSSDWYKSNWYGAYLRYETNQHLHPKVKERRDNAWRFLKQYSRGCKEQPEIRLRPETWEDLEILCGNNSNPSLSEVLDRTNLEMGTILLIRRIATPTNSVETIQQRQNITKAFLENNAELAEKIDVILKELTVPENALLAFWKSNYLKNYDDLQYPWELLNRSPILLSMKYWNDNATRFLFNTNNLCTMVALGILGASITSGITLPNNLNETVKSYDNYNYSAGPILAWISASDYRFIKSTALLLISVFCTTKIKKLYRYFYTNFIYGNCMQQVMTQIAHYMRSMSKVYKLIKNNDLLRNHKEFAPLYDFFETKIKQNSDLRELMKLFKRKTFSGTPSLFSHQGAITRAFILLHKTKDEVSDAIIALSKIDMSLACAKLYREHQRTKASYCFPQFIKADSPQITIKNFWHPFIEPNKVVTNSLTLGTKYKLYDQVISLPRTFTLEEIPRNIIVTGPNAGGKSTVLKSLAIAIILAQTIGIAPAQSLVLTPFAFISSYLNITDNLGDGNSLFKAEVLRAQDLLNTIQNLNENEFNFTLFDEMFTGTSPREGAAAAFSIAKRLGESTQSICCFATHFPLLTSLGETSKFNNYKVTITQNDDHSFIYNYKLIPGISDQNIAIDILRTEGFDDNLLNEAQEILNQQS